MYKLPERRGGGGGGGAEVIWAMPERKHLFLNEVFPNDDVGECSPSSPETPQQSLNPSLLKHILLSRTTLHMAGSESRIL